MDKEEIDRIYRSIPESKRAIESVRVDEENECFITSVCRLKPWACEMLIARNSEIPSSVLSPNYSFRERLADGARKLYDWVRGR